MSQHIANHNLNYMGIHSACLSLRSIALNFPRMAVIIFLVSLSICAIAPQEALAELPTSTEDVVPDGVATDGDVLTQGAQLGEIVVKVAAGFLAILAIVVPLAAIITSFGRRKQGDNSEFNATLVGGLFVMVLGLGIGILVFTYAGGIADQLVTVGTS